MRVHQSACLLMIMILCFALTGCGTADEDGAQAPSGEHITAEPPTPDDAPGHSSADEAVRVIPHYMGETSIEGIPERVVSLFPAVTDFLLSLDITPIGAVPQSSESDSFTWYLADALASGGAANVGWFAAPNLEVILDIEPDLILGMHQSEKAYDNLNRIAPTILVEPPRVEDTEVMDWRKWFRDTAEIFGRLDQAERVIAEYDRKAGEARQSIREAIGDETVMFLRVYNRSVRYYSPRNLDMLYEDLAVQPPVRIPDADAAFEAISVEVLPEINPDHIFLLNDDPETAAAELTELSIWRNLPAVRDGKVYTVDHDLWFQGHGPIGKSMALDEAVRFLTE